MKNTGRVIVLVLITLFGCASDEESAFYIFSEAFDFREGHHEWEADFTGYPISENLYSDTIYQWETSLADLPDYLGGEKALKLSCYNASGAIFMFIKKKISGLQPSTNYTFVFEIDLASNAHLGQGIMLKAGANSMEPKKIIENNSTYTLNLDKGDPGTPGEDLILLGEIGSSLHANEFSSVVKTNANASTKFTLHTNSKGEIWLIVGTDTTYEGLTTVYYKKISVVFSASN